MRSAGVLMPITSLPSKYGIGCFSKSAYDISAVVKRLYECGVNDLLLSVDAFHQETIPLEVVKLFATAAKNNGIPIRLQPAWLVSIEHNNEYNKKTREILDSFKDMEIPKSEGNVIFPEGNARKYLSEYFTEIVPENPYVEDACDVRCVSFSANGDVLNDNIYKRDVMDIIKDYAP